MKTKIVIPLSIVIPTKNEEKNIENLLKDINKQTVKPFEIIVSDANSTDNTRDISKKYGAKVIEGGIPSVGRNRGAKECKTKTILFLDADMLLIDRSYLYNIHTKFISSGKDCATCLFKPTREYNNIAGKIVTYIFNTLKYISAYSMGTWLKFDWTRSLIVDKEAFESINGFREDLTYLEDSQFIRDIVKGCYSYSIIDEYVYVGYSRELGNGLKQTIKVFSAALLGFIYLSISKFDVKTKNKFGNRIYNKAKELYGQLGGPTSI